MTATRFKPQPSLVLIWSPTLIKTLTNHDLACCLHFISKMPCSNGLECVPSYPILCYRADRLSAQFALCSMFRLS